MKIMWDTRNIEHIKKHRVSQSEVQIAVDDIHSVYIETYLDRIIVLGRARNRLLAVVIHKDKSELWYVVTARDMDKKARNLYRKEHI